jgi:CRP/FNR family transcriptional regulator, cyclic AMP receptor protein
MARAKVDPVAEALGKVDLFAGLSPKELGLIAGLARQSSYVEGENIVTEGDTSARFYLLTDGTANVEHGGRVLARLAAGDYVGEMAVLDGLPRSATVRATGPVEVLSLASFSLRPVLKEHPEILMKLLARLCLRLREAQASPTH